MRTMDYDAMRNTLICTFMESDVVMVSYKETLWGNRWDSPVLAEAERMADVAIQVFKDEMGEA